MADTIEPSPGQAGTEAEHASTTSGPQDLRTFLERYEKHWPEDVLHVEKPISVDQDMTAFIMQLDLEDKYPIVVFHDVRLLDGTKSAYPLITNICASRRRIARMIGSTFENVGVDFYRRGRVGAIDPVTIPKGQAPSQEVVETGDQVDLYKFPLPIHGSLDAGQYFTAGMCRNYDPDSGIDNDALYRGWVLEKNKIRIRVTMPQHGAINIAKDEARGEKYSRMAIWNGHHPLAVLATGKLPYPGSHIVQAGGLVGEPLRMVPSVSLGDDFLVPADAECVVEGLIEVDKRYPEGPFTEYTRYFGGQVLSPEMTVTAVTYRKDALWYDVSAATFADHQGHGGPTMEGLVWEYVKPICTNLDAVFFPLSASQRFHCYLRFKNPRDGEARRGIMIAAALDDRIKHVFTFDHDVNIYDEREVLWAIATRTNWAEDVIITPGTRRKTLDPSASVDAKDNSTGGIDCTVPFGEPFEVRNMVDRAVWERMQLRDMISEEKVRALVPDPH